MLHSVSWLLGDFKNKNSQPKDIRPWNNIGEGRAGLVPSYPE